MRSKGSRFTLGVWGLRVCSLDVAEPSATVRNRPQPSATVRNRPQPFVRTPYGRAYGKFCRGDHFWPKRAFRTRLPPIFTLCSFKIDVFLRVFLRTRKFATSKSMFRARLPPIFSTCQKMPRLPRNLHLVAT